MSPRRRPASAAASPHPNGAPLRRREFGALDPTAPPEEAEAVLLGALLIEHAEAPEVLRVLVGADFGLEAHRAAYAAIAQCAEDEGSTAFPLVVDRLAAGASGYEAVGGAERLAALLDAAPFAGVSLTPYIRKVAEASSRRALREASEAALALATEHPWPEALAYLQERLGTIEEARRAVFGDGLAESRAVRSMAEVVAEPELLRPPVAVVRRLAWKERITLLAGREKSGKSTLAGYAVASLTTGRPYLGEALRGAPGRVFWVALDEPLWDTAKRLEAFGADLGAVDVNVGPFAGGAAELWAWARRLRPALIVLDHLAAYATMLDAEIESGDFNAWQAVLASIRAPLVETGAGLVLIHHAGKGGGYRDSTAIGAGVDVIIEVEATETEGVRRNRVSGRLGSETYEWIYTRDAPQLYAGQLSADARILEYLARAPGASNNQIATAVGGRRSEVLAMLAGLESGGLVRNNGTERRAEWYLVAAAPDPETEGWGG